LKDIAEFAGIAHEPWKNLSNFSPVVTLLVSSDVLSKYKSIGKGYTSIMTDALYYVAENQEIFVKAL
jgi:uncharacterized protein (DUF4415 family)